MSRVNLLNWRRKKLSQRSFVIVITGALLLILLIVLARVGVVYYQQSLRELDTLNDLYQHLVTQLSQRLHQQQTVLHQLEQADLERKRIEGVRDELITYRFFFQWLTERLPEHFWLTTLTAGQSGWMITGQSLRLEEIEQFIQQLLSVKQVTALSLNDLKRKAEYYEFRVSFLISAGEEHATNGR
ncbi:hypothetical protein HH682_04680 [Rosenbergiella sp. S61]|uniref:Pilus assembly protein HofN n=1 Tax=Rosenbergiella gaditana TaxID=2726987 RepID=A0ABS5SV26_9GAMM|nr:PilN domain-containing protein [Rosenbergiella gaditana]MBT0723747.1 hypothetical protein [Rosenbergiella gaditana]